MNKMDEGAPPPYPFEHNQQNAPPPGFVNPQGGYPQYPGPGYPQGQGQGPTVVTTQPQQVITVITGPNVLGYDSQRMTCPYCQHDMSTNVKYESGAMAHIVALVLCLVGCWFGCCCIPYCVDGLKDAQHECANCHRTIGMAKRLR